MSKITKVKKYAVLWMNSLGHSRQEISSELKVQSSDIEIILSEHIPSNKNNVKQLIQNTTLAKNTKNVAIMTKEASSLADDNIKNMNINIPSRHEKNIFRPK